jgi:hypothetical protein
MSRIIDNLIAYRILTKLVKPFAETDAFRLGIIDAKGKNLIKPSRFTQSAQYDAYTYLDRLVFNMKKIINRLPGGETKLKSIIAAVFLIREYHDSKDRTTSLMEERYLRLLEKLETENVILVEEEMAVNKFFDGKLHEDGVVTTGPVANVTGAPVSTDKPKIFPKDIKKYQKMAKRSAPLTVGTTSVSS